MKRNNKKTKYFWFFHREKQRKRPRTHLLKLGNVHVVVGGCLLLASVLLHARHLNLNIPLRQGRGRKRKKKRNQKFKRAIIGVELHVVATHPAASAKAAKCGQHGDTQQALGLARGGVHEPGEGEEGNIEM